MQDKLEINGVIYVKETQKEEIPITKDRLQSALEKNELSFSDLCSAIVGALEDHFLCGVDDVDVEYIKGTMKSDYGIEKMVLLNLLSSWGYSSSNNEFMQG